MLFTRDGIRKIYSKEIIDLFAYVEEHPRIYMRHKINNFFFLNTSPILFYTPCPTDQSLGNLAKRLR